MNKNIIYILLAFFLTFFACISCKQEEVAEEDAMTNVSVEVPDLELDEEGVLPTRTSLVYVEASKKMLFNWENGDRVGVFNVSNSAQSAHATLFSYRPNSGTHDGTTATARFINSNYSFDQAHLWVAYCPALCVSSDVDGERVLITNYGEFQLTYRGQTQSANGTPKGEYPDENDANSGYSFESEAKASLHLGAYDYLISAPSKPSEDGQMTFVFSHVGSTVRFYVLFPEGAFGGNGKVGKVTSMSVINEAGNLVSDVKLKIKQQTSTTAVTPSYEELSRTTTKQLTLNFCDEQGEGVEVPDYGYFIAYMKFYPVTLTANSCYLYFTVMVDGVKKYFKSKPLTAKTMKQGKLYQWTTGDFNTPIELTATLTPWQDIYGGTISTGDE